MKRIFLVVMAAALTLSAVAGSHTKKLNCKKCTQTHCTAQCAASCNKGCCKKS